MHTTSSRTPTTIYEIQVSSRIDPERAAWLGNFSMTVNVTQDGSAVTILSGMVSDQAALFGILNRIRDLGLRLISVKEIQAETTGNYRDDLDQEEKER